ncbi:IS110 family transposase [Novosphingobium sp. M1R2S20]|uniref:IS110 family transposase n=1 Tax=Novosphingobium rhizovicinum TaxID=3228928 RepID=A0ABV3R7G7_9SPHN
MRPERIPVLCGPDAKHGTAEKISDILSQTIGIDISKASLDCHAYPAGAERQFANNARGHKALIACLRQWPIERIAYEATATYHRALEAALADWPCVKLNPERARRFAQATGMLAKTDRIDAMLLARMAATLQLPIRPARSMQQAQMAELINAGDGLVRDRAPLKIREKNLTVALLKRQCRQRREQNERNIEVLDAEITGLIAADAALTRRHQILTSIAGVGTLTANQLIATMPELGNLANKQAPSLAGLAPITRQSGQWKGKSFIRGGRADVRQAPYMAALVAARFNPDLKAKYQQLVTAGKPARIAITAVMRKLVVIANALLKADRCWQHSAA